MDHDDNTNIQNIHHEGFQIQDNHQEGVQFHHLNTNSSTKYNNIIHNTKSMEYQEGGALYPLEGGMSDPLTPLKLSFNLEHPTPIPILSTTAMNSLPPRFPSSLSLPSLFRGVSGPFITTENR